MEPQKVRVTKTFYFEAAHALDGYNGKCKDIHGHSYELRITVLGYPRQDISISECGMVIDFGDIKQLIKEIIMPLFDHRLILRSDSRFMGIEEKNKQVRYVSYQPTCENMLLEIVEVLKPHFTLKNKLHHAFLRETPSSVAEWHASDNIKN